MKRNFRNQSNIYHSSSRSVDTCRHLQTSVDTCRHLQTSVDTCRHELVDISRDISLDIVDSGLDKISCHSFTKINFLSNSKISTDSNDKCDIQQFMHFSVGSTYDSISKNQIILLFRWFIHPFLVRSTLNKTLLSILSKYEDTHRVRSNYDSRY